jgi:hypothetical protein
MKLTRRERRAQEAELRKSLGDIDPRQGDLMVVGKRIASAFFKADGQIPPMFLVEKSDGDRRMIITPWTCREEKYATYAKLREMFRDSAVVRCAHLAEVWACTPGDFRPSEAPDRREIVMVHFSDKNGGEFVASAPIERDADGAQLGDWEDATSVTQFLQVALFDPPSVANN